MNEDKQAIDAVVIGADDNVTAGFLLEVIVLNQKFASLPTNLSEEDLHHAKEYARGVFNKYEQLLAEYPAELAYLRAVRERYFPTTLLSLNTPTDELIRRDGKRLSNRTYNALRNKGIKYLGELVTQTPAKGNGIGDKTYREIIEAIQCAGYQPHMNLEYTRPLK